jgi:hypothetical protein
MDQTIMRFATTTARDAAFGGVDEPVLAEGMTAYIDADNSIYTYDGSNWVKVVSASTPVGMVLLGTFTGAGTSSIITADNVFTNEYQNYRIAISLNPAGVNFNALYGQFINTAGSVVAASYYSTLYSQDYASGTTAFGAPRASTSVFYLGFLANSGGGLNLTADIMRPFDAIQTTVSSDYIGINSGAAFAGGKGMSMLTTTAQCRGFRISSDTSSPNLTGTIRVYGYRD